MKRSGNTASLLAVIIVALLFAGCMGGGPAPTKTYSLTVTVLSAANDSPLAGASVEVAGNKTESKVTDADGKVTFSGLKGTVEVLVEMVGFAGKNEKLELNKD